MSRTHVVFRLILKDWWLHSPVMILSVIGGAVALVILRIGGQTPFVLGAVFFFISMMVCASLLPMSNIVNERKKQTLAFMMSLPVSASRYGAAKLVSTVGMFMMTWLALILANVPFIGFCLITGAALVGESEAWGITATAIVNSSYWLAWYLLASRFPAIMHNATSLAAVWDSATVNILGAEFASILLILGLAMILQSRKRDFI